MKASQFVKLCSCAWLFFCFCSSLSAQPYVDPLQVRYMYGLRNPDGEATPHSHLWIGSDVPLKLKENTYLLLSPTYEQWQIDSADTRSIIPVVRSFAIPVGLLLPVGQSKWSITVLPIARWNGEQLFTANTFQFGGAAFASFEHRQGQKFRIGVYANDEFFGLFIVPLVGVDWRLNDRNYVFGMLPGRLTYEHQWSAHLFGGLTFRSPTNSYYLNSGQFVRIDDSQLSAYVDAYLSKHIVFTLEAGYGIFRELRFGIGDRDYIKEIAWGDGVFIKMNAAYRIRLDGRQ